MFADIGRIFEAFRREYLASLHKMINPLISTAIVSRYVEIYIYIYICVCVCVCVAAEMRDMRVYMYNYNYESSFAQFNFHILHIIKDHLHISFNLIQNGKMIKFHDRVKYFVILSIYVPHMFYP